MARKSQNQSGIGPKLAPSLLALMRQANKFDPNVRVPLPELSVPRDIYVFTRSPQQMPQLRNNTLTFRFFNLVFNLKGAGQAVVADVGFQFKPGNALLVFPGQPRRYNVATPDDFLWLFIGFRMETYADLLPLKSTIISFPASIQANLSCFLSAYIAARSASQSNHAYNTSLCLNLYSLLTKLTAEHNTAKHPNSHLPPNENLVRRVQTILLEKPSEYRTSRQLAQALNISTQTLNQHFRQAAGKSLGKFIRIERISRARDLLDSTQLSIKEIASACGFGSPNTFSRLFKQIMQRTPRQYRHQRNNHYCKN